MTDFKPINTQEEFDERIKERLERAEKKARESFTGWTSPDDLKSLSAKHADEIKALKESHAKEMEKYAGYDEKFNEQAAKIHSLEVSALKTRIANEKKLPMDAIEFLQGEDEQSITDSADRLSKLSAGTHVGFVRSSEQTSESSLDSQYRSLAQKFAK